MIRKELAIRNFVRALYLAELVRDKPFEIFVKIANEEGFIFSDDDAIPVLRDMKKNNEELPQWLSEKIGHVNDGRPWPD